MASQATDRVRLTAELYRKAMADCAFQEVHLERISSADPEYPSTWAYLARAPRDLAPWLRPPSGNGG